jgi:glycolate dehydrogenase iron-sulfur subunit
VLATGAELMVTANPGCLMQVAASVERLGGSLDLAHTVELLDASLRGRSVEQLRRDLALAPRLTGGTAAGATPNGSR